MPSATPLTIKSLIFSGQWERIVGASERDRTSDLMITSSDAHDPRI